MDSTVVAVFEDPQRAEDARRDLLARGLVEDKDLSVVRQRSAVVKKGPLQAIKGMFGSLPPLRERAVLTVYADADRIRQAERIIRQHDPKNVELQLSAAMQTAPSAPEDH
jgi:hypothetical protein